MDALIVVDMQVGLLNGEPKHDLRGVVERIIWSNLVTQRSIRLAPADELLR
jgi:hypothetical protein